MNEVMALPANSEKRAERGAIRVLLIEDDPVYARLVRNWIDRAPNDDMRLEHAGNLASGLDRLACGEFDLVLLDLVLPDSRGYESFTSVIEKFPHIPVIVITGMTDDGQALRALRGGAQDYLVKWHMDGAQLLRAVIYAVERGKIARREEDFFQNVNHELRNPLTALYTAIVALEDESGDRVNAKQREFIDIALRNVKHLRRIVDDLLDATRADTGKISFAPRGLALADEILELAASAARAAAEKGITLATDVSDAPLMAYADPARLRQILLNLVWNALEFTPPGGTITISARLWEKNGSFLLVEVTDSGPGIAARDKNRIFERLYQSGRSGKFTHKGLGIGLYICRQLTSLQGGKIWVEDAPERGSRFRFTLPVFSLIKAVRSRVDAGGAANQLALISISPPANGGEPAAERLQAARRALSADQEFAEYLLPSSSYRKRASPIFLLLTEDRIGTGKITARLRVRFGLPTRSFLFPLGGAASEAAPHSDRLTALIEKRMEPPARHRAS